MTEGEEKPKSRFKKILNELSQFYEENGRGMLSISKSSFLKLKITPPKKDIIVLLMGLHSTGKSTLINYFFGTDVQKVSLSRATTKITIIKSGIQTTTSTLSTFKQNLTFLDQCPLLLKNKSDIEIKTVKTQLDRTDSVILIDTPGYSIETPNITKYISELAKIADLIYVLVDPVQTLELQSFKDAIHTIYRPHYRKIKFFLNKADLSHDTSDLNQTVSDRTSEIYKIVGKYDDVPDPVLQSIQAHISNIEEVGDLQKPFIDPIREEVKIMVQHSVDKLEDDNSLIDSKLRSYLYSSAKRKRYPFYVFGILLCLIVYIILAMTDPRVFYPKWLNHALLVTFVLFIYFLMLIPRKSSMKLAQEYLTLNSTEINQFISNTREEFTKAV